MIIGIPKEIKNQEYRVGLMPRHVQTLVKQGHHFLVEQKAGEGIGVVDDAYIRAGASICSASELFEHAEMVIKVKEPQAHEIKMLRPQQILFTYLHLAPDIAATNALIDSGVRAIAYETVKNQAGGLPLLAPMSEVAGRLSIQAAAHHLEKKQFGSGKLLSGIPGVPAAKVVIIGAGIVGSNALQIALGMGADVTVLDKNIHRLRELDVIYGNRIRTKYADENTLRQSVKESDVVIGAVLIPGCNAPKLVSLEDIRAMRPGSVIVDVAIDQGGCFATSKPTTHDQPTYLVEGVIHYCVANMPGAVPMTSTEGLTNATFPYIEHLANRGFRNAILENLDLQFGVSVYDHHLTCASVAASQNRPFKDIQILLKV
jgi:alanine dehydrogenase